MLLTEKEIKMIVFHIFLAAARCLNAISIFKLIKLFSQFDERTECQGVN